MFKILASLVLIFSVASAALGASDPASAPARPEAAAGATTVNPPAAAAPAKTEAQPEGKLKADMLKLVADAKAGKTGTATPRPQQPAQSNSLSKGKKIAIVVVVAAAVAITIAVVHTRRHLLDNLSF
jgi:hypothetical protein